jgi:hypothetical protein
LALKSEIGTTRIIEHRKKHADFSRSTTEILIEVLGSLDLQVNSPQLPNPKIWDRGWQKDSFLRRSSNALDIEIKDHGPLPSQSCEDDQADNENKKLNHFSSLLNMGASSTDFACSSQQNQRAARFFNPCARLRMKDTRLR